MGSESRLNTLKQGARSKQFYRGAWLSKITSFSAPCMVWGLRKGQGAGRIIWKNVTAGRPLSAREGVNYPCVCAPRIKRLLPVPGLKVKACGSERFGRIWIRVFVWLSQIESVKNNQIPVKKYSTICTYLTFIRLFFFTFFSLNIARIKLGDVSGAVRDPGPYF